MTDHQCGNVEIRASRMVLALLSDDEDAYRFAMHELAGCSRCYQSIAHWCLSLVAGDRAFQAGSRDKAADAVLAELDRVITVTNAPW
jgi:hypothetical protein